MDSEAAGRTSAEDYLIHALLAGDDDQHVGYIQLAAFVDGALSHEERSDIESHLAACSSCAADAEELAQVARSPWRTGPPVTPGIPVAALARFAPPPRSRDRRPPVPWQPRYLTIGGLTAAAAVALYVLIVPANQDRARRLAETEQALAETKSELEDAKNAQVRVRAELREATDQLVRARGEAQRVADELRSGELAAREAAVRIARLGSPETTSVTSGTLARSVATGRAAFPAGPDVTMTAPSATASTASSGELAGMLTETSIRFVLREYQQARSTLDWEALQRAWPQAPSAYQRAWQAIKSETIVLTGCALAIDVDTAQARCEERITTVTRDGPRSEVTTNTLFRFMRLEGNRWVIVSVDPTR